MEHQNTVKLYLTANIHVSCRYDIKKEVSFGGVVMYLFFMFHRNYLKCLYD
jgi:hypothetical protein